MKIIKENWGNDQGIEFMGVSIVLILILLLLTKWFDAYRYDLEWKWSKMDSKIRIMVFYGSDSYDKKRKFYLEHRILFERIATDAIKIYAVNTPNSYNERIRKDMERNKKLLDEKFTQIYKRRSVVRESMPATPNVTKAKYIFDPIDFGEELTVKTIEFHNEESTFMKPDSATISTFSTPVYGVSFDFPGFKRYGYISQKKFAIPLEMIDSQWVIY